MSPCSCIFFFIIIQLTSHGKQVQLSSLYCEPALVLRAAPSRVEQSIGLLEDTTLLFARKPLRTKQMCSNMLCPTPEYVSECNSLEGSTRADGFSPSHATSTMAKEGLFCVFWFYSNAAVAPWHKCCCFFSSFELRKKSLVSCVETTLNVLWPWESRNTQRIKEWLHRKWSEIGNNTNVVAVCISPTQVDMIRTEMGTV